MASLPEGITLLIVEGNVILALDVEDMLIRKGANRVDVVGSCEDALLTLHGSRYDAAVIDLNLPSGAPLALAARLSELRIPFAFCANHGERAVPPEPYSAALLIHTPCNEAYLTSMLMTLLDSPSSR